MTQSVSYNLTTTRDAIITRALRIVGAVGEGETPTAAAITAGAEALNDLTKEWETDGMPLWSLTTYGPMTLVLSQAAYAIGVGAAGLNTVAPLRVTQAWYRNNNRDTPINIVTRDSYNLMQAKSVTGTPTLFWYNPPGGIAATEAVGTVTVYPTPDTYAAANDTVYFTGIKPFMDFDASTDVPDFPQYWYNAVKWGLADQLAYEYGVGLAERSMISKKALFHKQAALDGGAEEGSMFLLPTSREERK